MKKITKFLLVSTAVLALVNLSSCSLLESLKKGEDTTQDTDDTSSSTSTTKKKKTSNNDEEEEVISYTNALKFGAIKWKVKNDSSIPYYYVNQENVNDETLRGLYEIQISFENVVTCLININNQYASSYHGLAGFVSCLTANNDPSKDNYGTYNFLVSGIRNNQGKIETYVSAYYNISSEGFRAPNLGLGNGSVSNSYDSDNMEPYEVEILRFPTVLSDFALNEDCHTLNCAIKYTYNDDGSITVDFLKDIVLGLDGKIESSSSALNKEISASILGRDSSSEKGKIAAYACIYVSKEFSGGWQAY